MANVFIIFPDILPTFCCNKYTCVLFLSNNLGRVLEELNVKLHTDKREISTLPKIVKTPRSEVNSVDVKIQRAKGKKQLTDTAGKHIKEIDRQSKEKEEKVQKINPSNQPKNIRTTSENQMPTKLSRGVGIKSVHNSVEGTVTIENKSRNTTCVEFRTDDENFASTKNCTSDSLETLKTHPDHRNAHVLTQHLKAVSSHPVDCHSRHRNIKEIDSVRSYSSVTQLKPPSQSAQSSSEDLGRNTFNLKDPKVLKRLASDFPNVGSTSKMYLKVNVKPLNTEETSKVSLEHKEGFPGNLDCDTLKPVQAVTTFKNSLYDPCVNANKPIIPFVAKPTKSTKKALPSNPWPSTDISNSGQARTKKHITASVLVEKSPSSQSHKATKETTHTSHKPLEDLLKGKELTVSNKHQRGCHHLWNCDDPQMCLLTSAAENQSEASHFRREYKKCPQFHGSHQRTMEKSKQNTISLPGKTQKADTLEKLVKHKGAEVSEYICQTTEGDPGRVSFIETKSEALSNSSKFISPQKTRISTNEKNRKRVIGMANKAKMPHTLSAVGENCAAKQKLNKNELSSCSLSSTSYHPALPSMTTTPTFSVDTSTTITPSGPLTQRSGLSPGHQRPRQVLQKCFAIFRSHGAIIPVGDPE